METYYKPEDLERFAEIKEGAPDLWKKYSDWYSATMKDGKLSRREKALIALAVAHVLPCSYCIDAYAQECLECGSNIEEMTEAVHVAATIRGGAALAHGVQMRNVVEKLSF